MPEQGVGSAAQHDAMGGLWLCFAFVNCLPALYELVISFVLFCLVGRWRFARGGASKATLPLLDVLTFAMDLLVQLIQNKYKIQYINFTWDPSRSSSWCIW